MSKTKIASKQKKSKITKPKDSNLAVNEELEYQAAYEKWEFQYLGYSDLDLH